MKPMNKAIAVALIHVGLVGSLGAKLLYDRRTRPQVWLKTENFDPDLPIRGRYLSVRVEVRDPRTPEEVANKFKNEIRDLENQQKRYKYLGTFQFGRECGSIVAVGGIATAQFDGSPDWNCDNLTFVREKHDEVAILWVTDPVMFFIADTARIPHPTNGDELWVLATIPRKGPPRPLALGMKKAGEQDIQPLDLK
jgi:hypothetical protein